MSSGAEEEGGVGLEEILGDVSTEVFERVELQLIRKLISKGDLRVIDAVFTLKDRCFSKEAEKEGSEKEKEKEEEGEGEGEGTDGQGGEKSGLTMEQRRHRNDFNWLLEAINQVSATAWQRTVQMETDVVAM